MEETDFCALEKSVSNLNFLILQTKTSYYENLGKKLNDPTLQSKTYCSILKVFYNGKKSASNFTYFSYQQICD